MWGNDFHKKTSISLFIFFQFILLHLIFLSYYCPIDLKRQSQHSGLCPDMSSFAYINYSLYTIQMGII